MNVRGDPMIRAQSGTQRAFSRQRRGPEVGVNGVGLVYDSRNGPVQALDNC